MRLLKSFKRAGSGLSTVFKQEANFRIQSIFGILVFIVALVVDATIGEFIILFSAISFLLILELVNTAIERVVDVIHPRVHSYAAVIKDLMAAAVLLAAIVALVVVLWILGKHVIIV